MSLLPSTSSLRKFTLTDTSNSRPKDPVFVKSSADNLEVSITSSNKPKLFEAEDSTMSNHDTGKVPSNESQRNATDHSVVVSDFSATDYDSAYESSFCIGMAMGRALGGGDHLHPNPISKPRPSPMGILSHGCSIGARCSPKPALIPVGDLIGATLRAHYSTKYTLFFVY
ncbi:hypothetical protein Tco_1427327 [Tanacetum coccineum]